MAVVQVVPREGVLRSHISVVNLLAVFSSCAATTWLPTWVYERMVAWRVPLEGPLGRWCCLHLESGFVVLGQSFNSKWWFDFPQITLSLWLYLTFVYHHSPFSWQHKNGINHSRRAAFLHEGSECSWETEVAGCSGELQSLFDWYKD